MKNTIEGFKYLTEPKTLVWLIVLLVGAWGSWSTAAIVRNGTQHANIRENIEKNRTTAEGIQRDLQDIKHMLNMLLDLELTKNKDNENKQ